MNTNLNSYLVLEIKPHPEDNDFEFVQFNEQLRLVRCKKDGMYLAQSIRRALNSTYNLRSWFTLPDNKEMLNAMLEYGNYGSMDAIHHVKEKLPRSLRGKYVTEDLVYPLAQACDKKYCIHIQRLLKEAHNNEIQYLISQNANLQNQNANLQNQVTNLQNQNQNSQVNLFRNSVRTEQVNSKLLTIYRLTTVFDNKEVELWKVTTDNKFRIDESEILFKGTFPASLNIKQELRKRGLIGIQHYIRDTLVDPIRTMDALFAYSPKSTFINHANHMRLINANVEPQFDESTEDTPEIIEDSNDESSEDSIITHQNWTM